MIQMSENEPIEGSLERTERKFHPKYAVAPIALMVVFIIATIGFSLYISPYFRSLGYSSAFGDRAENPLWAFAFLAMMIIVAVGILLLRKLLKRRKRNLKYVLAFAVFLATMGVLTPMLDLIVNGAPQGWNQYELDLSDIRSSYPLDPDNYNEGLFLITDDSFHVMIKDRYSLSEIGSVSDLHTVFEPHFRNDIWLVSAIMSDVPYGWTIDIQGTITPLGELPSYNGDLSFIGAQLDEVKGSLQISGLWANESHLETLVHPIDDMTDPLDIQLQEDLPGPFSCVQGWTSISDNYILTGEGVYHYDIIDYDRNTKEYSLFGGGPGLENTTWGTCKGDLVIFYTRALHYSPEDNYTDPLQTPHLRIEPSIGLIEMEKALDQFSFNLIWNGNDDYLLEFLDGSTYYQIDNEDEETQETTLDNVAGLFRESEGSDVWIVDKENTWNGDFSFEERNQYYLGLISLVLSIGLIVALLKKPKWWLVDIGGFFMGAGVIAIMGISFPILFTLLLLVLLAGYDAVAVYKTKHMISLADSVVEAKMPILLVFPMKWSYRYEDETNLMDPKRKRESLFMGLGDVIIPGLFVVSVFSFISPVGGARLFGFIYPPLGVALFTLSGMLLGYGILMRWVLKGKAHAGLPPLNGGSILGFLIGYLLLYGTIVFW